MTSVSSVGGPTVYVPGGQSVKTQPDERTIPNPEKQEMGTQFSPTSEQKRMSDVIHPSVKEKKGLGVQNELSSFEDGTQIAYPEEEQFATGLVCVDGRLVQELRDPVTQEVMAQIPRKSCAKYEEMSVPTPSPTGVKIAS